MANTILTPTWYTKRVSAYWMNSLRFARNVDRSYDDQYQQAGAKVGFTVNARLPQRFIPTFGQALQVQSILNQSTPITLTDQIQIAFAWSSASATMEIEEAKTRYAMPAAESLANAVDGTGLARVWKTVNRSVGVPGTTSTSNLTYLQAVARLRLAGVPEAYVAVLGEMSTITLTNANVTVFNPQNAISEQFRKGEFTRNSLGVESWNHDQNVSRYTTGSFTSCTPLVDGANQTGSSILTKAFASGATSLKLGDIVSFAGVYEVNPISYVSTGQLMQFTLTADVSDTSGAVTLPITPSLIPSGQLQNVTNSPADNAKVYVQGSTITTGAGTMTATLTSQSLLYNKAAFALVLADLEEPQDGATASVVRSKELNLSIRMVKQYNSQTDFTATRFDILQGWATVRPEYAVRSQGA